MATSIRVITNEKNQPLPNQQAYGRSINKKVNHPQVTWFLKYLH